MSRLFHPADARHADHVRGIADVLRRLPHADSGPCSDCSTAGPRRRYGEKLMLCSSCSTKRLAAARSYMTDPEFDRLVSTLAFAA